MSLVGTGETSTVFFVGAEATCTVFEGSGAGAGFVLVAARTGFVITKVTDPSCSIIKSSAFAAARGAAKKAQNLQLIWRRMK